MKRHFTVWLLVLAMVSMVIPATASSESLWEGSGTEDDPWLIKTTDDFVLITTTYSENNGYRDKFFKLENNLDFTGITFTPAGVKWGNSFNATFDGNDKEITNLTLDTGGRAGLFGYIAFGTIKDLTIRSGSITGNGGVGGIASEAQGGSSIINCKNYANVTGVSNVGGIVGYAKDMDVISCYNGGTVSGSSSSIGGIVGQSETRVNIENCHNDGALENSGINTGGIVGNARGETVVSNCYNTGNFENAGNVTGGIVGILSGGRVESCYNDGIINLSGKNAVGGIAGKSSSVVERCYNLKPITSNYNTGGIAGEASGAACLIRLCYNYGLITNNGDCGGIVGKGQSNAVVTDCYNMGEVNGQTASGIVGSVDTAKVINSYSSGSGGNGCVKWQKNGVFANLYYNSDNYDSDHEATGSIALPSSDFASGKVAAMLNANHVEYIGEEEPVLTPIAAAIWSNDDVKPIFADLDNYPIHQYEISGAGEDITLYVKLKPADEMKVIIASYEGSILKDVAYKTDSVLSGRFDVDNLEVGDSVCIFFWDDFTNATPLCEAVKR